MLDPVFLEPSGDVPGQSLADPRQLLQAGLTLGLIDLDDALLQFIHCPGRLAVGPDAIVFRLLQFQVVGLEEQPLGDAFVDGQRPRYHVARHAIHQTVSGAHLTDP